MLDAAKAMKLSAKDLLDFKIIDEIIPEPLGGAHRDRNLMLQNLKNSINKNLDDFKLMSPEEIFNNRKNKFLRIGRNKGFINNLDDLSSFKIKSSNFYQIFKFKKTLILGIGFALIILAILMYFL